MIRKFFARLRVIIHHYSTWVLSALVAVGGLYEFAPAFRDDLPSWTMPVLALIALVVKLIPQGPKPGEMAHKSYMEYRKDLPR